MLAPVLALALLQQSSQAANPLVGLLLVGGLAYGLTVSRQKWKTLGFALAALGICIVFALIMIPLHVFTPGEAGTLAGGIGSPAAGIVAILHGRGTRKQVG